MLFEYVAFSSQALHYQFELATPVVEICVVEANVREKKRTLKKGRVVKHWPACIDYISALVGTGETNGHAPL